MGRLHVVLLFRLSVYRGLPRAAIFGDGGVQIMFSKGRLFYSSAIYYGGDVIFLVL